MSTISVSPYEARYASVRKAGFIAVLEINAEHVGDPTIRVSLKRDMVRALISGLQYALEVDETTQGAVDISAGG